MYFSYGETESNYLKMRDKKLAVIIDEIGHVYRATDHDLFSAVVHQIIGQQISTKAQTTIWNRMQSAFGTVSPEVIATADIDLLQSFGITFRKADYIREFAQNVLNGTFDLKEVERMPDAQAIAKLTTLKGVGTWTAEMILLFCLERSDILSYSDLAIQRGLRMVYRHRTISRGLFEKYRARYSPYGSVASLYLWEVAGGAIEGLTDPADKLH